MRVRFKKGKQKEFLDLVRQRLLAPSIRGILQFGVSTNYSSLKNYYSERRLLPKVLFDELLHLARLERRGFEFELVEEGWGQSLGGKRSKRGRLKN